VFRALRANCEARLSRSRETTGKGAEVNARRVPWRAACAALLACLVATSLSPAAVAHGPRNGRIAFSHAVSDGAQDIVTIGPNGGDVRALTALPPAQGAELPAWDPNGDRVYFDSDLAGNVHLFAVNGNGHGPTQLTHTDGFEIGVRVSPDGRLVALEHEDSEFTSGGVFVARKRGLTLGGFRQLTASPALAMGGFDTPGDFSPDGSKLTFLRVLSSSPGAAASAIFVIGLDGRGLTQVTPYSLNASIPRWSPDGSRLLFSSNWDNFSDQLSANVYSVRPDGTRLTQITHDRDNRHAFTPDWAPDGTRIVYAHATPDADSTELRVRNLATGRVSVIWRGSPGTHDQDPDWGPRP
jgi:Tol biopolymer transport system component